MTTQIRPVARSYSYNSYPEVTLKDDSTYRGQLENGKPHGSGVIIYPKGSNCKSYDGEFSKGLAEGKGTMHYTDESTYVGDFEQGKREGQGTCSYVNGTQYEGKWHNDQFHGQGIFYDSDKKYIGSFVNGKYQGRGIMTYNNENQHVGEFKNNQAHGQGQYTVKIKDHYSENFSTGVYTGVWENGTFKDGTYDQTGYVSYSQQYRNGEVVKGCCTLI